MLALFICLIFIRPFISSLAFPYLNFIYSSILFAFLFLWVFFKKGAPLKAVRPIKYPLILFILALIVSVIFSYDKLNSFRELYKYIASLLIFLTCVFFPEGDKNKVIKTLVLAGFIIGLLAIYQYFFGFKHLLDYISKHRISDSFTLGYINRSRVFFPFVTPNTLAGYLAMIIPLTLINRKWVWLIVPLSFALLLTKSLGALLSLFLALVIYFYLKKDLKKGKILLLAGLLTVAVLVLITRLMTQKPHLLPIFSTVMRLSYWKDTLKIIVVHPLTGVGLGNFNLIQSRYAHNSYLQIWAEAGILSIISLLWLTGGIFKQFFRQTRKYVCKKTDVYLFIASFIFVIHNLIDFTFFLPEVSLIWWVILGLFYSGQQTD